MHDPLIKVVTKEIEQRKDDSPFVNSDYLLVKMFYINILVYRFRSWPSLSKHEKKARIIVYKINNSVLGCRLCFKST
jgi:hypothetical protein